MSTLAVMTWGQWALATLLVFVCFILMLVILLQKGRGGGLAGAFGGAGGTSAFGAKTGDVFTWITVVVAGVFVSLTIWGNFLFDETPKPRLATGADAAPTTLDLPLEDLDGAQPGQPIKMELGIVDPETGEMSTIRVPADPAKPTEAAATAGEEGEATAPKPMDGDSQVPSADENGKPPPEETPSEDNEADEEGTPPNP